jgi:hypothetical protein
VTGKQARTKFLLVKRASSGHAFSPPKGEYSGKGDVEEEQEDERAAQDTLFVDTTEIGG